MKRQARTGSTSGDSSTSAKVMLAAAVLTGTAASALGQGGLPAWIEPPEGSVRFGSAVASGADVDGDGINDIYVADPGFTTSVGQVGRWFVYSGATLEVIWSVVGEDLMEPWPMEEQYRFPECSSTTLTAMGYRTFSSAEARPSMRAALSKCIGD